MYLCFCFHTTVDRESLYFRAPHASTFSVYSVLVYSVSVYSSVSNRLESKQYSCFVCVCWGGGGKLCIRLSNFLYHVPSHFVFRYHPVILKGIFPFRIVSCARSLSLSLSPSLSLSLILACIYFPFFESFRREGDFF